MIVSLSHEDAVRVGFSLNITTYVSEVIMKKEEGFITNIIRARVY